MNENTKKLPLEFQFGQALKIYLDRLAKFGVVVLINLASIGFFLSILKLPFYFSFLILAVALFIIIARYIILKNKKKRKEEERRKISISI